MKFILDINVNEIIEINKLPEMIELANMINNLRDIIGNFFTHNLKE